MKKAVFMVPLAIAGGAVSIALSSLPVIYAFVRESHLSVARGPNDLPHDAVIVQIDSDNTVHVAERLTDLDDVTAAIQAAVIGGQSSLIIEAHPAAQMGVVAGVFEAGRAADIADIAVVTLHAE